jgi:hypothetical protein
LPAFPPERLHGGIKARETCITAMFRSIRVTSVRAEGGKIMVIVISGKPAMLIREVTHEAD